MNDLDVGVNYTISVVEEETNLGVVVNGKEDNDGFQEGMDRHMVGQVGGNWNLMLSNVKCHNLVVEWQVASLKGVGEQKDVG